MTVEFFFSFPVPMRKSVALIICLGLFAGCGGNDDQNGQLENPTAAFAELTAEHRQAWQETILELLPQMRSFEKSNTRLAVNGNAQVDDAGNRLTFDFIADGKSDLSDPADPKVEANLSLSGTLNGGEMPGNANAALVMKVVNSSIFLSLKSLEVDFPSVPTSEILAPIKPLIGKWYGDSFDTISDQTGQSMNIQDVLVGRLRGPGEVREQIAEIIGNTEVFILDEYLGAEAGMQRFAVTVDNAALISAGNQIIDLLTTSDAEKTRMKTELEQTLSEVTISGTLALDGDEPKYFAFDGTVVNTTDAEQNADILISFMPESKTFAVESATNGESGRLEIKSEGDSHVFTLVDSNDAGEEVTVMTGTKSESALSVVLYNPETSEQQISIDLTETGGSWSGTITNADQPENVIEVEGLAFDEQSFEATFIVKNGDEVLATINISYEVEEIDSVIVTPPESYDPFANLIGNFLPLMMMGAPGISAPAVELPTATSVPGQPAELPLDDDTGAIDTETGTTIEGEFQLPEGVTIEGLPEGMTEADIQAMLEASGASLPQ